VFRQVLEMHPLYGQWVNERNRDLSLVTNARSPTHATDRSGGGATCQKRQPLKGLNILSVFNEPCSLPTKLDMAINRYSTHHQGQ
jgi:hypothetical protein